MQQSEESKGDLCFLISKDAKEAKDIPITLVYCNQQVTTEDATDRLRDWAEDCGILRNCIAFYHAKVGSKRKCEIEEGLKKEEIHILLCTDAVGMVCCNMCNISCIILWGLPLSFCALVQCAGCAARDFQMLGEAILIVSSNILKRGTTEDDIQAGLSEMIVTGQSEAENRSDDVDDLLANADLLTGSSAEVVGKEGIRIQAVEVGEGPSQKTSWLLLVVRRRGRRNFRRTPTHGRPNSCPCSFAQKVAIIKYGMFSLKTKRKVSSLISEA